MLTNKKFSLEEVSLYNEYISELKSCVGVNTQNSVTQSPRDAFVNDMNDLIKFTTGAGYHNLAEYLRLLTKDILSYPDNSYFFVTGALFGIRLTPEQEYNCDRSQSKTSYAGIKVIRTNNFFARYTKTYSKQIQNNLINWLYEPIPSLECHAVSITRLRIKNEGAAMFYRDLADMYEKARQVNHVGLMKKYSEWMRMVENAGQNSKIFVDVNAGDFVSAAQLEDKNAWTYNGNSTYYNDKQAVTYQRFTADYKKKFRAQVKMALLEDIITLEEEQEKQNSNTSLPTTHSAVFSHPTTPVTSQSVNLNIEFSNGTT